MHQIIIHPETLKQVSGLIKKTLPVLTLLNTCNIQQR